MYCHTARDFTCPLAYVASWMIGLHLSHSAPFPVAFSVWLNHLDVFCHAIGQSAVLLINESNTYSQRTEGLFYSTLLPFCRRVCIRSVLICIQHTNSGLVLKVP